MTNWVFFWWPQSAHGSVDMKTWPLWFHVWFSRDNSNRKQVMQNSRLNYPNVLETAKSEYWLIILQTPSISITSPDRCIITNDWFTKVSHSHWPTKWDKTKAVHPFLLAWGSNMQHALSNQVNMQFFLYVACGNLRIIHVLHMIHKLSKDKHSA